MINITTKLVFNETGEKLNTAIRKALKESSDSIRNAYDLESYELNKASTKTEPKLLYSKYVEFGNLLQEKNFSESYLENAFALYEKINEATEEQFYKFVIKDADENFEYSKTAKKFIKCGIGLFLVSLHCKGIITLPFSFSWPTSRTSDKAECASKSVCASSELVAFVRSVQTVSGRSLDPVFKGLRTGYRVDWFSTFGTKLLLSTGWLKPEHANYNDFLNIYSALNSTERKTNVVSVYDTLSEILRAKYSSRINGDFGIAGTWDKQLALHHKQKRFETKASLVFDTESVDSANEAFAKLKMLPGSAGDPARLKELIDLLPNNQSLKLRSQYWFELQKVYCEKVKRENYRPALQALGFLNLYLFSYLPAWFKENATTKLKFPTTPDLFVGVIYVSRLIPSKVAVPRTFMEMMNERSIDVRWDGNTYYSILKQVEVFFNFIVDKAHYFNDCEKFRQPLSTLDFPKTSKLTQTNKEPIPRRFFAIYLDYVEAIKMYVDVVIDKVISGEIGSDQLKFLAGSQKKPILDTFKIQKIVGFIPCLFAGQKKTHIRYLPGFSRVDWKILLDGRIVLLPHPHGVNQILVSLLTGLRHNHLQWLDLRTFDKVADTSGAYTRLIVNTDKATKQEWKPHVNTRVIEILRDQLAWRNLIAAPKFMDLHYYNNEKNTEYKKILPLFSYSNDGRPHPDSSYEKAWKEILCGFQGMLLDIIDSAKEKVPTLCKLRPAGVWFIDLNEHEKLSVFNDPKSKIKVVELRVQSDITPHSARVSVVSNTVPFLSAELIGKCITGQKPSTVAYYVKLVPEEMQALQAHQAMDMKKRALEKNVCNFISGDTEGDGEYIAADAINSRLAKSMHLDLTEALARYGCISITLGEDFEGGVDILQERGIAMASFNKTEICPFGNICPAEIIMQLKGLNRCSICPYAVRSIDHLPAVCVRKKYTTELFIDLTKKMKEASLDKICKYTVVEMDRLEEERVRLGEEVAGWELCQEVLEQARQRLAAGVDTKRWVVEQPEILFQKLQRLDVPSDETIYLLSRLKESIAYPGFQSPFIAARFDMARMRCMSMAGKPIDEILSLDKPIDAAAECAGVIRSLVQANSLTMEDIFCILSTDKHLDALPLPKKFRISLG